MVSKFSSLKAVFINILSTALYEFIKTILYTGVITGALAWINVPSLFVYGTLVLGLVNISVLFYRNKNVYFQYIYKKTRVYFNYNETKSLFSKYHEIITLVNGVDRYNGFTTWEPANCHIICTTPRNAEISWKKRTEALHKYEVTFGGTKYKTGQCFPVDLKMELDGDVSFPALSTTVTRPTKYLEVKIKLPKELLKSSHIRLMTIASPTDVGIMDCKEAELNDDGEYTWEIKKPKWSFKYTIEWDFSDEKQERFNIAKSAKAALNQPVITNKLQTQFKGIYTSYIQQFIFHGQNLDS